MALVSVKDFGEALNISGGTIRSKISRKQLCCNRKGLIDTENPRNFIYLLEVNSGDQSVFDKYSIDSKSNTNVNKKNSLANENIKKVIISKSNEVVLPKVVKKVVFKEVNDSKALVKVVPTVETKKVPVFKEPKMSAEDKEIIIQERKQREILLSFDIRKKEAELKLVERNAELKQWELEKKAGNSLPLDMIEKVIAINYKAVLKSSHSQVKNIATVIVQQLGGSKDDLNRIMIELEAIFENTVKDSKKKSAVDIEKLIDEYSEIRSRGERKV